MSMPPRPPERGFFSRLSARYDLQALQPPEELAAPALQAAMAHPGWTALLAWCQADGPWAARHWPGEDGPASPQDTALAHALGLVLDGSLQLRACRGGASRLALRLRTQCNDLRPWRKRQPTDPWDAGWLRPGAAGLQALQRFQPRRPTLLLAGAALGAPHQRQAEALLAARQPPGPPGPQQGRALRLLVLRA